MNNISIHLESCFWPLDKLTSLNTCFSFLFVRGCSPLWSALDWWWPIWPMVSSPPSSGLSSCPSCGWWVDFFFCVFVLLICVKCTYSLFHLTGTINSLMCFFVFFSCAEQIRVFTNTFTLTPYNGAEALVCCHTVLILKEKVFKDLYLYSEWIINMKSCSGLSFTALAVSSKVRVSGSEGKVSQFNIRTWN